jgi:uncharacterized protein involved in response to NO
MSVRWRDAEPYRLLFPLGVLLGLVAVSLWPLFVYKAIHTYPGIPHARMMIEGFAACFILGFLGTALPHMLAAPRFTLPEILAWCAGLSGACLLHLSGRPVAGDLAFAFTLVLFLGCVAARALRRTDRPPPGLITVMLGLVSAIAGASLQALYLHAALPALLHPFSRLLLNQAFLLLPVMGVGAYILPVFIGYPRRQSAPLLERTPGAWTREALSMAAFGLALIAGMALEAAGFARTGNLLRGLVLLLFLARHLPVHRRQQNPGTMAWLTRLAMMAMPVGFLLLAAWPRAPLAWLHILYLNGLGLLITAVATRVIVAHGGFQHLFPARWPALWWVFGLITLAMATRVSADWMPDSRFTHYAYAALSWIGAMLLWLLTMHRFLLASEAESMDHKQQLR